MLSVHDVSHRYGDAPALAPISLQLERGEHCALLGPSGCGKSTLLHILAGILTPSSGTVLLEGEALYPPGGRSDLWRARRIGVVPQKLHLLPSLSARGNVQLAHYLRAEPERGAVERVLEQLGLTRRAAAKPDQLSVGEQQRVAIARAIVGSPRLLLADEPTSSLDDANADTALQVLFEGAALSGALLVIATHDARVRRHFTRVTELTATA